MSNIDVDAFLAAPDEEVRKPAVSEADVDAFLSDDFDPSSFVTAGVKDDSHEGFSAITDPLTRAQTVNKDTGLKRGEWIKQKIQSPYDQVSDQEFEEALQYDLNQNTSAGEMAGHAWEGLKTIAHDIWTLPKRAVLEAGDYSAQKVAEAQERGESAISTLPGTIGVAAGSLLSGMANTGADVLRQVGKLGAGAAEKVYTMAGGEASKEGPHTGWTSTDITDFSMYRAGKLSYPDLLERYKSRHLTNKGFTQQITEEPNPAATRAAQLGNVLAGEDADLGNPAETYGKEVIAPISEAGSLYIFGELNKPAEVLMRAAAKPLMRGVRAGVREATAFSAPAMRRAFVSAGSKMDDVADNLASRGLIDPGVARGVKEANSLIGEVSKLAARGAVGAAVGEGAGVGGGVGALVGMLGLQGGRANAVGMLRGALKDGAKFTAIAEQAATVASRFAKQDVPYLKAMSADLLAKSQAAAAAGKVAEAASFAQWAAHSRYAAQLIKDGASGQSIFRHIAENASRMGIDKRIARAAFALDRKPVKFFLDHGIPTANAVMAGGMLNALISLGMDPTDEQIGNAFGMGGLAVFGVMGRAAKMKSEGRTADLGRDITTLHRHFVERGMSSADASQRVAEFLGKVPDIRAVTAAVRAIAMEGGRSRYNLLSGSEATARGMGGGAMDFQDTTNDFSINLDSNRIAQGEFGDAFAHEFGHPVAKWLRENNAPVWHEFGRTVDSVIPNADLARAKTEYAKLLVLAETQGQSLAPGQLDTLTQQKVADLDARGDEYFLNEVFADSIANAFTSRDLSRLAVGSRGGKWEAFLQKKGIAQASGSKGESARAMPTLYKLITHSRLNKIAEKALGEYLHPLRDSKGVADVRSLEAPEPVQMRIQDVAMEAYNRAKQAGTHTDPSKPIVDAEWGQVFETPNGPDVRLYTPEQIKAKRKARQQAAIAYINSTPGNYAQGWGKGMDGEMEVFGGVKPPTSFFKNLKKWGFTAPQQKAAIDWARTLGTGDVLQFWNLSPKKTSLSDPMWERMVRKGNGPIERSRRDAVPMGFRISKKGDVLLVSFDVSVLERRLERFAERGHLGLWGGDTNAVRADVMTLLANWKAGNPGETNLSVAKKEVINAIIIGKGRKNQQGVNPFRDALGGQDAAGIFRTFRLDRIEDITRKQGTGYHFDYEKAQRNAIPDTVKEEIQKTAADLKARYDGPIEVPGTPRHQFTIENPESPAHKATFIVKGEPTKEAIAAKVAEKEGQFRALPDSQEMEQRGMYGERPELIGARLGLRYEGRIEGGSMPAHQYRDQNGKRYVISGAPTLDALKARLTRGMPDSVESRRERTERLKEERKRSLPEKFWLSPDGEIINNRDFDREHLAHDKTAQSLMRSKFGQDIQDPDEAFRELIMKGYRRGVWHKGTTRVSITEPLPGKAMLSTKQGEALETLAYNNGYRVDIDSMVKPRKLYDGEGYGGRAMPDKAPDTPEFKSWFGDSKVVDEQGKPKVVYHGSPDIRGILKDGFKGFSRGEVFFVTDSYNKANTYADSRRAFDYQNAEDHVVPLYLSIENPLIIDAKGKEWKETAKHVQEAKDGGYDGIIIKNSKDDYNNSSRTKPGTVYAFFKSSQAKSAIEGQLKSRVDQKPIDGATANSGAFSKGDPRIQHMPDSTPETRRDRTKRLKTERSQSVKGDTQESRRERTQRLREDREK